MSMLVSSTRGEREIVISLGSPGAKICGHCCGLTIFWGAFMSPRDLLVEISVEPGGKLTVLFSN